MEPLWRFCYMLKLSTHIILYFEKYLLNVFFECNCLSFLWYYLQKQAVFKMYYTILVYWRSRILTGLHFCFNQIVGLPFLIMNFFLGSNYKVTYCQNTCLFMFLLWYRLYLSRFIRGLQMFLMLSKCSCPLSLGEKAN